jgi:hypothetical protein
MASKEKVKKSEGEKTAPSSVSRPIKLAQAVDKCIRQMSNDINVNLSHSQVVCALEELMMENSVVYGLLLKKLKG